MLARCFQSLFLQSTSCPAQDAASPLTDSGRKRAAEAASKAGVWEVVTRATEPGRSGGGCYGELDADEGLGD